MEMRFDSIDEQELARGDMLGHQALDRLDPSRPPCREGNSGSSGSPSLSFSQTRRRETVVLSSGVSRRFLLPRHLTCAPVPSSTSASQAGQLREPESGLQGEHQ